MILFNIKWYQIEKKYICNILLSYKNKEIYGFEIYNCELNGFLYIAVIS